MLERWRKHQREKENKFAPDSADLLRSQFGDLPFNEGQTGIIRFSDEAREQLAKERYIIYSLTGQSIKTLKDAGRRFWSTWHKEYPDFEALQSRLSEVAINPKQLSLVKSKNKTFSQQLGLVARFSQDLSRKVLGVEAIIAEAPDYIELAFAHLDATGQRLFGEDFDSGYARTVTPVGDRVADVGNFNAASGLHVVRWHPDDWSDRLWAAPLVVPSGKVVLS